MAARSCCVSCAVYISSHSRPRPRTRPHPAATAATPPPLRLQRKTFGAKLMEAPVIRMKVRTAGHYPLPTDY
jgi:hypothetical protein